MRFGTIVSPNDPINRVGPGRILIRNSSDPSDCYIAFTSDVKGEERERFSVFIGPDINNGVIYTHEVSYPAWDVTDFVEIRPDFNSGKLLSVKPKSRLKHGSLFITSAGEIGIFGGAGQQQETIAISVETGAGIQLRDEVVVFEKWRLAVLNSEREEIGSFDPETFYAPPPP